MANLNNLIFTAADYKALLIIPNVGTFPLQTIETISYNNAREEETIYAVGVEEPIGSKRNAAKYSGKLTLQNGELSAILQIAGLVESTQIAGAILAITSVSGVFNRTHTGLNINGESLDVKAKDKQSIVNLDWTAISIK
jgi:hypothetical protein